MSPAKAPQSSGDPPLDAARGPADVANRPGAKRPAEQPARGPDSSTTALGTATAAAAAWLIYTAIYACVFALSEISPWVAIRAAVANAIPDGVLTLAAIAMTRRLAWPATGRARFPFAYAALAPALAGLAGLSKTFLLWVDVFVTKGGGAFRFSGAILAWQVFISLLIFVAVGGISYAQTSARRLRQASEAAERAEMLRARAELSSLRAQLNPHFLFNILHSVLGLVRRDPTLAEKSLERLGDLLRYALHVHRDGIDWTPLRSEWEFMESYLDLERIRLGDRLRASLHADTGAFDRLVPSFLLQPLVENAVRHAIARRAGGGSLNVHVSLDGRGLRLVVDNDGGPPAPAEPGDGDNQGLGLRLLRERIETLYGGRARISFGPTSDGRYRVELELPDGGGGAEGTVE